MHLELAFLLDRALQELDLGSLELPLRANAKPNLVKSHFGILPVNDCDPKHQARLVSTIAFHLAAELNALVEQGTISPLLLAQALVAGLERLEERGLFEPSLSSLGHLNFTPTPEFVRKFIAQLELSGAECLFRAEPLLVGEGTVAGEQRSLDDLRLEVDWIRLQREVAGCENEDSAQLISERGANLTGEDRLMLAALLGDSELEVKPYLAGWSSRQNVPWYLKQAARDASAFAVRLAKFRDQSLGEPSAVALSPLLTRTCFVSALEDATSEWEWILLRARSEFRGACRGDVPRYLTYLTRLAQAFYAVYNHPAGRHLERQLPTLQLRVAPLAALTGEFLRLNLRILLSGSRL